MTKPVVYRCIVVFFLCNLLISHHLAAAAQILFSPADQPTKKLISLIKDAKKSVYAAVYMLTDKTIALELIKKRAEGITVKIITDPISMGMYGKAEFLTQNNVDVLIFDSKKIDTTREGGMFNNDPIMHNKFMIIDQAIIWTGSFNWTVSANRKNYENVIILDDKKVIASYMEQFNKLLLISTPYTVFIKDIKRNNPSGHHDPVFTPITIKHSLQTILRGLGKLLATA